MEITTATLLFYGALIFIGFFVACIELAFQYFMMPNMILYPYAVLLSRISRKNEVLRHLMRPLGRCRYCNATWIAMYVYFFLFGRDLQVFFLIGSTFLFLRVLSELPALATIDGTKVDNVESVVYATDTPWQAMLKSYLILGSFYLCVYTLPLLL